MTAPHFQLRQLPRELRSIAKAALAQGWAISLTRKGTHAKWLAPHGKIVFTSSSPSDHRAFQNIKADLRRAGLALDELDHA